MHSETHEKKKIVWWKVLLIGIVSIYIITGGIFAILIYKSYPDDLSAQNKKYPDQQKVTVFMTKIYPYPAAIVNGQIIWVKDLYEQIGYNRFYSEKTSQPMPPYSQMQEQILGQMVDMTILKQQAKKNKITVSKQEIDDTYNKLSEQQQGQENIETTLKQIFNMTVPEFKKLIADQLLVQKIQNELFVKAHAKHIVVKDEGKAKEILDQIKNGKSFEDAAKEFSEDTATRDNGGDLGWFNRGAMVPEFEDAVFKLKAGEMTQEPVKTEFGFHIIKLEETKGNIDKSYMDWFTEIKNQSKITLFIKNNPPKNENANTVAPAPEAPAETPVAPAETPAQ